MVLESRGLGCWGSGFMGVYGFGVQGLGCGVTGKSPQTHETTCGSFRKLGDPNVVGSLL